MQMRLEGVRGVMLDLDGTVYDDPALIPGAAEGRRDPRRGQRA